MSERGAGLSGLAHAESTGEVVERYDAWVDDYETDVRAWGYDLPEQIAQRLVAAVDTPGDCTVVDAGCGTGLVGQALRSFGFNAALVGSDVSQESLRVATTKHTYTALVAADIAGGLPLASNSVDAVACGGVLTYVPDTYAALSEFVRVLRPGGVAVASQRTDLWAERDCDDVVARLRANHIHVEVGMASPYLPALAEYGEAIQVVLVTLRA